MTTIQSVSRESRVFEPPTAFAEAARVPSRAAYEALYRRSIDDPEGKGRRVRVSAGQSRERSNLFTTSKSAEAPSDVGLADANALLQACSEGPITKQARGTLVASERTGFGE